MTVGSAAPQHRVLGIQLMAGRPCHTLRGPDRMMVKIYGMMPPNGAGVYTATPQKQLV